MKTLFLDIDGVLNFYGTEARTPNGCVGVVDSLVKRLKTIVDNTGAILVLSSSWKDMVDVRLPPEDLPADGAYLVRKLRRRGLHLSSKTSEEISEAKRGAAIMDWLQKNDAEDSPWCILDDLLFDDYLELQMLEHLVLVNPQVGLSDGNVKRAIDLLNGYAKEGEKHRQQSA